MMKENSFLGVVFWYIKGHIKTIIMDTIFVLIFIVVFSLYSLEIEAIIYATFLSASIAIIFVVYDFIKYYKKHKNLCILKKQMTTSLGKIPLASNLIEVNYQNILLALYDNKLEFITDNTSLKWQDFQCI